MRYALCALTLFTATAFAANIPIFNGDGATIDDLIREGAYVTLLVSNAPVKNLKILSVSETTITVDDGVTGRAQPYPINLVRQIRVQDGRVASQQFGARRLTPDERSVVDRALDRSLDLFDNARGDQRVKMLAALVSAADGNRTAIDYLRALVEGNDAAIAVEAAGYLYLSGATIDDAILARGFASGNRQARAMAAKLAGLLGREAYKQEVRNLLKDPTAEVFMEAAKAAGRLGDERALPELYAGLTKLNRQEGLAAAYGISEIGGEDVRLKLWSRVRTEGGQRGEEWYRALYALFLMDDREAKNKLREEAMNQPIFGVEVALLLADDEEWAGTEYLRNYLNERTDPNVENLLTRAAVAGQLYEDGMLEAKVILRDLSRITPDKIYGKNYQTGAAYGDQYKQETVAVVQAFVAVLVGQIGNPDLLPLLPPLMASENEYIAVVACRSAVALDNRDFAKRMEQFFR